MPEFRMNGRCDAFTALDAFTQGCIECIFFTNTEPGTTRETWNPETQSSLPGDVGFQDLAPETLASIIADCERFQKAHAKLLAKAYNRPGYDEERAGRDFWYTRNGHGVGFWDRDELGKDLGAKLSACCGWRTKFPDVDVYLGDDGKVYS